MGKVKCPNEYPRYLKAVKCPNFDPVKRPYVFLKDDNAIMVIDVSNMKILILQ